jgi:hypothetical protein
MQRSASASTRAFAPTIEPSTAADTTASPATHEGIPRASSHARLAATY